MVLECVIKLYVRMNRLDYIYYNYNLIYLKDCI